ncbi:MAG: hypothetical protein ACLTR5_00140 [Oscillospiraceae bacterium]
MNEQEALRREMLDRRIELIFEEMERNHPEFSQEEAELSHIRDEIEQDPLLGPAGKKENAGVHLFPLPHGAKAQYPPLLPGRQRLCPDAERTGGDSIS